MARIDPEAPLALVCAVRLECVDLLDALDGREAVPVGGKPAWRGRLHDVPVWVVEGGMGKVNAAQALTALLEGSPARGVLGFGVAGAYRRSGLGAGAVALASSAVYADEGVAAPGGWVGVQEIGIPLAERGAQRWFNEFPADPAVLAAARSALDGAGIPAAVGPFLTVSSCSGTAARGDELAERWGALCEGMEGAALAHVAALYAAPFLEVRGVSNAVEDRDLSRWRLADAAVAVQRAVRVIAAAWPRGIR